MPLLNYNFLDFVTTMLSKTQAINLTDLLIGLLVPTFHFRSLQYWSDGHLENFSFLCPVVFKWSAKEKNFYYLPQKMLTNDTSAHARKSQ